MCAAIFLDGLLVTAPASGWGGISERKLSTRWKAKSTSTMLTPTKHRFFDTTGESHHIEKTMMQRNIEQTVGAVSSLTTRSPSPRIQLDPTTACNRAHGVRPVSSTARVVAG